LAIPITQELLDTIEIHKIQELRVIEEVIQEEYQNSGIQGRLLAEKVTGD
jgi:hypothetical protein